MAADEESLTTDNDNYLDLNNHAREDAQADMEVTTTMGPTTADNNDDYLDFYLDNQADVDVVTDTTDSETTTTSNVALETMTTTFLAACCV